MTLYYILVFFTIGITLGSFYNVVGYRLPKNESVISPPSHCPNCNNRLTILELIPIFSFFIQKGKCKKCGLKISPFYPFFEFLTGLLFVIAYLTFGISYELLLALIFISMTLIIIISDYKYYIIPDEVLIISVVLAATIIFVEQGSKFLLISLLNGGISFIIMFSLKLMGDYIFKKESMGGGDIKLLFVYGFFLGWDAALLSIFIASFIGLPASLIMLYKNKTDERIIPFGPFLSISSLILLFTGINLDFIINLLQ